MTEHKVAETVEQNIHIIEEITSINRRNGVGRTVHAKGVGAKGYFQVYMPMTDYTTADFLQDPELETPVFLRCSTTVGACGSADTLRDERSFAVKFYTRRGNYDLISASIPVRFSNRPQKILQALKAQMPDPENNLISQSSLWEFAAENPESVHKTLWLFSDRGTLKSYRHMESYGVGTWVWINERKEKTLIRYRWRPLSGRKEIGRQEAEFLAGFDPDASVRDLYGALERGERPEYELCVQMASAGKSQGFSRELLNAALLWPEEVFPLIPVGKLTLTENPKSAWEETERCAFCPAHLVCGIRLAADSIQPTLVIAYSDANRHRLGEEENADINRPLPSSKSEEQAGLFETVRDGEVKRFESVRDGEVKRLKSAGGRESGRCESVRKKGSGQRSSACKQEADRKAERLESLRDGEADKEELEALSLVFQQAGDFYRSMTAREKDHLVGNLLDSLLFLEDHIKGAVIAAFAKAEPSLGEQLSRCVDI